MLLSCRMDHFGNYVLGDQTKESHNLRVAIHESRYFKKSRPLAVVSGAGIAGLAASFELRVKGFEVAVVEKRRSFSRFNIINLSMETQVFMRKFRLLEKFEKFVAGRIQQHKYLGIDKTQSTTAIKVSDVSQLELEPSFSFRSDDFDEYLRHDGIYSVSIADLQAFLAENALKMGVHIFGNVKPRIISRLDKERVSKIEIAAVGILRPNLFFIAEGVHSETAALLGMRERELESACSGEKWVFGSMHYSGQETFVISIVDASKETLRLANVIFNSVSRKMNVAVTVEEEIGEDGIGKEIQKLVQTVFDQKTFPIHQEDIGIELLAIVERAVHIVNRILISPSRGNIYAIGDLVGSSSPLAGAGGSIGLTFVPLIVSQLLKDYEEESANVHENFDRASRAYARRWIEKSHAIKTACMDIADTMNRG